MSSSRLVTSPFLRRPGLFRSARRSLATVQSRIGDKQVEMSNFEQGKYINYQRIEDTLQVVRSR